MLKPGDVVEVRAPDEILAHAGPRGRRSTRCRSCPRCCSTWASSSPSRVGSRRSATRSAGVPEEPQDARHGSARRPAVRWLGPRRLPGRRAGSTGRRSGLRRVDPSLEREGRNGDALAELEQLVRDATVAERGEDGASVESYRCQATEAVRATEPLSRCDLRQYVRELSSGNVGLAAPPSRSRARHQRPRSGAGFDFSAGVHCRTTVFAPRRAVSSICGPATWWKCVHRRRLRRPSTKADVPAACGSTGR